MQWILSINKWLFTMAALLVAVASGAPILDDMGNPVLDPATGEAMTTAIFWDWFPEPWKRPALGAAALLLYLIPNGRAPWAVGSLLPERPRASSDSPRGSASTGSSAGGAQQSHWLAAVCALAIALTLLGGCAIDPRTGLPRSTGERISIGTGYGLLGLEVLDAVLRDGEPGEGSGEAIAKVAEGIEVYCGLSGFGQAIFLQDVPPSLWKQAVARFGGEDADVCTQA